MYIGYIRVSSIDQNTARQDEALKSLKLDFVKIFTDKISGKNFNRPAFREMNNFIRAGDTLVVKSIDRLARSHIALIEYINSLYKKEIGLTCIDMPVFNFKPSNKLDLYSKFMLDVMSSLAELERSMLKERQREGIEAAKLAGKHLGRPRINPDIFKEVDETVASGKSVELSCKLAKTSQSSYYRYLALKKLQHLNT